MTTQPYEPGELEDLSLGVNHDQPMEPRPTDEADEPTAGDE